MGATLEPRIACKHIMLLPRLVVKLVRQMCIRYRHFANWLLTSPTALSSKANPSMRKY